MDLPPSPDRALALRCAEGEPAAWGELHRLYDNRILTILRRRLACGNADLHDLRQDVYARLLARDRSALRGLRAERPGALQRFVDVVTARVANDHARARRARPQADEGEEAAHELPSPYGAPDEGLESELRRRWLLAALGRLATSARDSLVLQAAFCDGLSAAEIARLNGVDLTTKGVETLVRRAREKLAREAAESDPREVAS